MNFESAVRAMKEGKKVSRIGWPLSDYWLVQDGMVKSILGLPLMGLGNLEATDWEISEEPKSLSDNIKCARAFSFDAYVVSSLKLMDSLQLLNDYIDQSNLGLHPGHVGMLHKKIKELFGTRLV